MRLTTDFPFIPALKLFIKTSDFRCIELKTHDLELVVNLHMRLIIGLSVVDRTIDHQSAKPRINEYYRQKSFLSENSKMG